MMDIIKQKQNLVFVIVLLVILNIATLAILWIGRPSQRARRQGPSDPRKGQAQVQRLLKNELGFDEAQIEKYFQLRSLHRELGTQLEQEIKQLKGQMFDQVLQENPTQMLSDSLLDLALEKQAQLERLTFQHFLDLKELCNPEQQDKLQLLMHEMLRQNAPLEGGRPLHPPKDGPPMHPPKDGPPMHPSKDGPPRN